MNFCTVINYKCVVPLTIYLLLLVIIIQHRGKVIGNRNFYSKLSISFFFKLTQLVSLSWKNLGKPRVKFKQLDSNYTAAIYKKWLNVVFINIILEITYLLIVDSIYLVVLNFNFIYK